MNLIYILNYVSKKVISLREINCQYRQWNEISDAINNTNVLYITTILIFIFFCQMK